MKTIKQPIVISSFKQKHTTMKKSVIVMSAALLSLSTAASAQTSVRFGLKGGLNLSHATREVDPVVGPDHKSNGFGPGFYAGGLAELSFPAGSKFKLQLEALYNMSYITFENTDTRLDRDVLSSIQVPLSSKYFIVPDFSLNAGVSAVFNTGAKAHHKNGSTTDLKNAYNLQPMQVGLHAGATYYIKNGFFVDARYNYYMDDVMESKTPALFDLDYDLGTFQLGLGYKF